MSPNMNATSRCKLKVTGAGIGLRWRGAAVAYPRSHFARRMTFCGVEQTTGIAYQDHVGLGDVTTDMEGESCDAHGASEGESAPMSM